MERTNYSSGTRWEPIFGYSRAIKVGDFIYVSGTTATDKNGDIIGPGDAYAQTLQALKNIETALKALGAQLEHVVRTRIYVTDIDQWEKIAKAHSEIFGNIRPASAMVEIQRLISPEMLVEIEADAVISQHRD
ncbi:MAG: RidA family protein [Anaerolineae bacterium]|nr:RidA family protein [Anaerolineae bacterium]